MPNNDDSEPVFNGSPLETEEQQYMVWKADARVFKKRGKDFYSTVVVLAILISVILYFIEGLMPVLLVWSVVFVIWVTSKTPPNEVTHKITSWGIRTDDELYRYEEMTYFWFEEKWGKQMVRVLLKRFVPGQLMMVIDNDDVEKVKRLLSQYLVLQKPKATWTDRAVKWLSEKIPLDDGVS